MAQWLMNPTRNPEVMVPCQIPNAQKIFPFTNKMLLSSKPLSTANLNVTKANFLFRKHCAICSIRQYKCLILKFIHQFTYSEPHLQPTPQFMATLDPQPTEYVQGSNPQIQVPIWIPFCCTTTGTPFLSFFLLQSNLKLLR